MVNIGILIASKGRKSLYPLLTQLKDNLLSNDEVVVVFDNVDIPEYCSQFPQFKFIVEKNMTGYWGHPIRTKYQHVCKSNYILNMDDDDLYSNGFRRTLNSILIREGYPDVVVFNSFHVKFNENGRSLKDGTYHPYTGNTIIKNKKEFHEVEWECVMGGDSDRYLHIINTKDVKVSYSDYCLIHKN